MSAPGSERPAPTQAVALRYAPAPPSSSAAPASYAAPASTGAPRVVAAGAGALAERMLALARKHGVPVREDPDLLVLLAACEVGDEIPVELYDAVARLLTALYRLNRDLADAGVPPRT